MSNVTFSTPVSAGELIDKITILELKQALITDVAKLKNVVTELSLLQKLWHDTTKGMVFGDLIDDLRKTNAALWSVEDELRAYERQRSFGSEFVTAARSVYKINDHRAALKRQINLATGSTLVEEKSYSAY